jgi:Kef-type K+ transport system membrane component KefB
MVLAGVDPGLALVLGAIATATAPAAMTDVIRQSGINNSFTDTLKGIVGIDDAWGLVVFSLVIVFAGQSDGLASVALGVTRDLGGGVLLGIGIGSIAALLTGRLKPGEPMQAEAFGIVFLTAGASLALDVSFLVSGMAAGAIIANFASHHDRAFHEIENIQWPFMVLFFLLGGATLELDAIAALGWIGFLYVLLRALSRILGGYVGARLVDAPPLCRWWYGPALLPQAGVAIGMALVAGEKFPQWSATIMALTIAATVFFELLGPPITLIAIRRVARKSGEQKPIPQHR